MARERMQLQTVIIGAAPGRLPGATDQPNARRRARVLPMGDDKRYYVAGEGRATPIYEQDIEPPIYQQPLWKRILKRMVGRNDAWL